MVNVWLSSLNDDSESMNQHLSCTSSLSTSHLAIFAWKVFSDVWTVIASNLFSSTLDYYV